MIGRRREAAHLYALTDGLVSAGGAAHVSGTVGIGKTELLTHVLQRAADPGISTTVRIVAHEAERSLPYSGAAQLFAPLRQHVADLARAQQRALGPCLGLAPPMSGNPLVEYTAATALVAAAARTSALILVIDDAHWLDQQTANLLGYVGRRLLPTHAAIIVADRPWPHRDRTWGFSTVELAGLTPTECRELARARGTRLTELELKRLHDWTGGIPEAVLDNLPGAPGRANVAPVEFTISPRLRAAWEQLLAMLPADTRVALCVAMADENSRGSHVRPALARMGLPLESLTALESLQLAKVGRDGVQLLDPMLAHLVDDRTDPGTRASVHHVLAELSTGHERAWHLAAAASHPDDDVSRQLAAAALHARGAEGFPASSRTWQRAAELSVDATRRADLLLAAATDAHLSGDGARAVACCEAVAAQPDPHLTARVRRIEGLARAGSGDPHGAVDCLLAGAEALGGTDAAAAADLVAHAAAPAATTGRFGLSRRCGERVTELVKGGGGPFPLPALSAHALSMAGQLRQAAPLLDEATSRVDEAGPLTDQLSVARLAQALLWAGRPDRANHLASLTVDRATASLATTPLALALVVRSEIRWWTGQWGAARDDAARAVDLSEDGDRGVLGEALGMLARIAASTGDNACCLATVERLHTDVEPTGAVAAGIHATASRGLLDLGNGDLSRTVDELESAFEASEEGGLGNPMVIPVAYDLGEALARSGHVHRASLLAAWLEERGQTSGLPYASGAALRLRAVLAPDPDAALDRFAHACALQSDPRLPFELARTLLCEGRLLRRAHRVSEARAPLRKALNGFRGLGASSWAGQAENELAATGLRHEHSGEAPATPTLSPQELQVALAVTRGLTNPEVAGSLFMSRKTVEAHLTRIYRKLGVHSRTDLTRLVAQGELGRDSRV